MNPVEKPPLETSIIDAEEGEAAISCGSREVRTEERLGAPDLPLHGGGVELCLTEHMAQLCTSIVAHITLTYRRFGLGEIGERLDDLEERQIALMDESGVDIQVLSVTTLALQNPEPEESLIMARRAPD